MSIIDKFRDEKLHYNINKEAKSLGKSDKNEYLTDKKILPSDECRIIEEAKFSYFLLGKYLNKKINKNDWRPRRKTTNSN